MSFKQLAKFFDGSFAIVVGAVLAVLLVQQLFALGWGTQSRAAAIAPEQAQARHVPPCLDTARIAAQADCLAEAARSGPILR
ncbi:hypothetical protein [Xylophilus sp.]|uniref:hypothetical protein n=1 Tax=Xylophilus sp. TaxID=2653893 RepID=UPI0013BE7B8A|nr:hypothetical protein [Xylophilus sp.]KAF1047412.1 MAG: hypothetical protein GAK38_01931 [Xylophilus sp.]